MSTTTPVLKKTAGYAATSASSKLAPFSFDRRPVGPNDIEMDILYCGVCHSDLHTARNEWKNTTYPCVPGHEIVGRITKIGDKVKNFRVGEYAAVGCLVDSCRTCESCKQDLENYCEKGPIFTYNSPEKQTGKTTFGGYSTNIVVDQHFVLHVSEKLELSGVAPLLCAGITTYSPLRHWGVGPGKKVAIVGLGGLGHMGVKLAHAMGAHVVMITTSPNKVADAKRLGADEVVISKNPEEMKKHANSFDFILDTIAAKHDVNTYLQLLKRDGTMCLVGAPEDFNPPTEINRLIFGRKQMAGSLIGGIKETQEMLDFCAEHGITADIELIPIDKINEAYERMLKSDVKYRFVIDIASLKK